MIKRPAAETAEAVTTVSVSSLKDMGITTVEEALQQISSLQGNGLQNQSAIGSFDGGISSASLRGLGGSRTLVLLDGQRLANNVTTGASVDLNMIPLAAVDHIEVLREGASSLYGSDAIAGVVNFITKKNLNGGEINVNYSKPQHAGAGSQSVDGTWGHGDLEADGYNLMVAASYNRQQELEGFQRSSFANGYNPAEGLSSTNGLATFPGSYIDNNGNVFQTGYPACKGNPFLIRLPAEGIGCGYLYSLAVDLVPRINTASGLIDFTKTLPGNNTVAVQYFYARNDLTTWGGPISYVYGMTPAADPKYFPTAANSTCVGSTCPATPDLVDPITAIWTPPDNNRYNQYINSQQRVLVTFAGQNAGWDYAADLDWGQNRGVLYTAGGYPVLSDLETPAGNLSPLINPFGPSGAAGNALINSSYVNGALVTGTLSLYDFDAHASHELGQISSDARPATFAFGIDARYEQLNYNSTGITEELESTTGFAPIAIEGNRTSFAAFTEIDVPVTKQVEATFSDREDYYHIIGSTNNAKIQLRYQPFSTLTFRGAASTGFRAPSLVDLYSPQVFGATSGKMLGPPCLTGAYTTVFSATNCVSQGLQTSGGNPDLKPETSQNFDVGVVFEPIDNLGISVDFYRVNVSGEIQAIATQTIYSNPTLFASDYVLNNAGTLTPATLEATSCPPPVFQKAPTCGYIVSNVQNTGGIQTAGFDINPTYLAKTDYGKFKFGVDATFVTKFRFQEFNEGPIINEVGGFAQGNLPIIRYQHLATLDWTFANFGAGLSNRFTEHYTDEYLTAAGNLRTVASYNIWNGYGSLKPIEPLTVILGIRNIADTKPPFSNQTASNFQTGYNPNYSDPIGRTFYVNLRYTF